MLLESDAGLRHWHTPCARGAVPLITKVGGQAEPEGPMSSCAAHIHEAMVIAEAMIRLADRREADCDHDGCLLLDGVIRDCAYKIRAAAERYREELIFEGWTESGSKPHQTGRG
jgi:hypothetical protein